MRAAASVLICVNLAALRQRDSFFLMRRGNTHYTTLLHTAADIFVILIRERVCLDSTVSRYLPTFTTISCK